MRKESENLWNEDELLTQLEQAQDQIDQLQDDIDNLSRMIDEKNEQLLHQRQTSSSEISKLQSALQQAQSKIQEQSDQIVKLNGADLIVRDNEQLKSENDRLVSENNRIMKEAAHAEEAAKLHLQKKEEELQQRITAAQKAEAAASQKEQQACKLIRNQDQLINEKAAAWERFARTDCRWEYERSLSASQNSWNAERNDLLRSNDIMCIYAILLSVLLMFVSDGYLASLKTTGVQAWWLISHGWSLLLKIAGFVSGISTWIPVPILNGIIYWFLLIIVVCIGVLAVSAGIIFVIRWICQILQSAFTGGEMLLILSVIMAITAFLAAWIPVLCHINVFYVDLILWIDGCVCWALYDKKPGK